MTDSTTIPDGYFGTIAERTKETDHQLGGIPLLPVAKHTFAENHIQYNQPDVSSVSCTLHGAIGAVSDLTGYTFTFQERQQLWSQAIGLGASNIGWYIDAAVDLVRKYWNFKVPDNLLTSFVVSLLDPSFGEIIEKGYSVVIGYSGNGQYNLDHLDGTLDAESFGKSTYGHCVRMCYGDKENYNLIVDNYSSGSFNIYKVPKVHLKALVDNGVFYQSGYVFVQNSDLNALNMPQNISPWAQTSVQKAKNKGLPMNEPSKQLTVSEIEDEFFKLGVLTQKLGNLTEERMAVICDRLKLL